MESKKKAREENYFENPTVAEEWINSVENDKGNTRDNEIYPMLYEWSKKIKPKLVVEIGAGQGICASKLDLTNGKYIGIEPSPQLVHRARELYESEQISFLEGDAYDLPVKDASADAAFSVGVWFHLRDLDRAHAEVGRILKPGARILICTAHADMFHVWESFFEPGARRGNILEGKVTTPGGVISKNILFIHSTQDIVDSLERSGFRIVETKQFGRGKERHRDKGIWLMIDAEKK